MKSKSHPKSHFGGVEISPLNFLAGIFDNNEYKKGQNTEMDVNQKLIEKDQDLLKSDRKTTRSRYKNISKVGFKKRT